MKFKLEKSELYNNVVKDTKQRVVEEINKLIDKILKDDPKETNVGIVELPSRIHVVNDLGDDLNDTILAVKKDEIVVNSMFATDNPKMENLPIELLIRIMKELELYIEENE